MQEGLILSENPQDHWRHLQCAGEFVLDLGCAYNDIDDEDTRGNRLGTPHFILSQNPKEYFGVDNNSQDIEVLRQEFPNAKFLCQTISSVAEMRRIVEESHPTIIKSDIEGAEFYLCGINPPIQLSKLAIECHGPEIQKAITDWATHNSFELKRVDVLQKHPHIKVAYFER